MASASLFKFDLPIEFADFCEEALVGTTVERVPGFESAVLREPSKDIECVLLDETVALSCDELCVLGLPARKSEVFCLTPICTDGE